MPPTGVGALDWFCAQTVWLRNLVGIFVMPSGKKSAFVVFMWGGLFAVLLSTAAIAQTEREICNLIDQRLEEIGDSDPALTELLNAARDQCKSGNSNNCPNDPASDQCLNAVEGLVSPV